PALEKEPQFPRRRFLLRPITFGKMMDNLTGQDANYEITEDEENNSGGAPKLLEQRLSNETRREIARLEKYRNKRAPSLLCPNWQPTSNDYGSRKRSKDLPNKRTLTTVGDV